MTGLDAMAGPRFAIRWTADDERATVVSEQNSPGGAQRAVKGRLPYL